MSAENILYALAEWISEDNGTIKEHIESLHKAKISIHIEFDNKVTNDLVIKNIPTLVNQDI